MSGSHLRGFDSLKGSRVDLFLFEYNPLWYGTMLDFILQLDQSISVRVFFAHRLPIRKIYRFRASNLGAKRRAFRLCMRMVHQGILNIYYPLFLRKMSKIANPNFVFYDVRKRRNQICEIRNLDTNTSQVVELNKSINYKDSYENEVKFALMEEFSIEDDACISNKRLRLQRLSTKFVTASLRHILETSNADSVAIMNGRTLHEFIAADLAKGYGKKVVALDHNIYGDKIQYFEDSVLNLDFIKKVIEENWRDDFKNHLLLNRAINYFNLRFTDIRINPFLDTYKSMSSNSNAFSLNLDHASSKKILFLTSSNDEMLQIQRYLDFELEDQLTLFAKIYNYYLEELKRGSLDLILRVHPNIRYKPKEIRAQYKSLDRFYLAKIYNFDSPINTYSLLRSASCVITTVSSMGGDAAFLHIPSISLIQSFYSELGITKKIDVDQMDLFELADLNCEEQHLQALKFANFQVNYGFDFVHYSTKRFALTTARSTLVVNPIKHLIDRFTYRKARN